MSPSRLDIDFSKDEDKIAVDLPLLRAKPSYQTLLSTLKRLELPPTSWDGNSPSARPTEMKLVSQYLLSIISSDLTWLERSNVGSGVIVNQQEELWELASKRLAERCGRSAMPEMIRTWIVPSSATLPELEFHIREPPLTGDNLGLKTWGTSFAVVKKLEELGSVYLNHLLCSEGIQSTTAITPPALRVLELGSGTGLVGIAAGAIWRTDVILSDLPEIEENLRFNIKQNTEIVRSMGGSIHGEVLDWKDTNSLDHYASIEFDIVIAADPLYDVEHPALVAQNIKRYIKPHESCRALVAIPMRDDHTRSMLHDFKNLMQEQGLKLIQHGQETCYDDWAEDDGDEVVKCWWGIWKP